MSALSLTKSMNSYDQLVDDPVVRRNAAILADLGAPLTQHARILDYGCGRGVHATAYRKAGFDAWGCDIVLEQPADYLRAMDTEKFRIPYEDASFDFVYSNSVLEHVSDHLGAAAELSRVTKRGAVALHNFPSKWRPVEPHVFVPLATVFRPLWWLRMWAVLGRRNSFQSGMDARAVAGKNHEYLGACTNYQSKAEMIAIFREFFSEVRFIEGIMLKHETGRAHRYVYPVARVLPIMAEVYGFFHTRMMFLRK